MIFYGLTTSVQSLGLTSINYNGMFLGVTQTVGYLVALPLAHKMKRKLWSIIFQSLTLIGAVILAFMSQEKQTERQMFLETVISTCWMAVINSAQFPLLFLSISELFPTRVRGLANAMVLFTGKLLGAASPLLGNMSVDHGFHVLCGCSVIVLVSLPASFLVKETLVVKEDEEDGKNGLLSQATKTEIGEGGEVAVERDGKTGTDLGHGDYSKL